MNFLLDTHVFLWYISADQRLPSAWQAQIQDSSNDVFLSVVSIWEAIVKYQLGKLPLPAQPQIYLPEQRHRHNIASLSIDEGSVTAIALLPPLHRDPFDRLLLAQAITHDLTVLTVDSVLRAYPAKFL